MLLINLTQGLTDNEQYHAWKFPGGEVHIKFKEKFLYDRDINEKENNTFVIVSSPKNSDLLMLLLLTMDFFNDHVANPKILVALSYMPYQQADRRFSEEECFSLKTVTKLISSLKPTGVGVFDPHSDVTAALLPNCVPINNYPFINDVINNIKEDVILLSPDAGAYKKIFKLAESIGFKGEIETANKYRNTSNGDIEEIRLSRNDFEGRSVLIVDDICMGGATFIALANRLLKANVGKMYLAISHGVLNRGLDELLKYFSHIYTTNSFYEGETTEKLTVWYLEKNKF